MLYNRIQKFRVHGQHIETWCRAAVAVIGVVPLMADMGNTHSLITCLAYNAAQIHGSGFLHYNKT